MSPIRERKTKGNCNSRRYDDHHVYMIYLHTELDYLDIGIKLWDMRKRLCCIFLDALYKDLPPISRYPDEMVLCFIDGMGTLSESHAPS